MIRREQTIKNDSLAYGLLHAARRPKTRDRTTSFSKLSAQMVDLSLEHIQHDSHLADIRARSPVKSECCPPEPKVQPPKASLATIPQEEAKQADQQSEFVPASRELLAISSSRMIVSDYWIRIRASRLSVVSLRIVALTLLAFTAVYGLRGYHRDSSKDQSQTLTAMRQPEKPVARARGTASRTLHNDAHPLARKKSKPRRRQADYIAKDTYVYYGKDGKPSH